MVEHNPVVLVTDIGTQQCSGSLRVIGRCYDITNIVQQGADYSLLIGAIALRSGGCLQAVIKTTDLIRRFAVSDQSS